jgi:hypothetical protein
MATAEQRNHARNYLKKAEEYAASAAANLATGRYSPAAGDWIHAGICTKDAIVTVLTGSTRKGTDHATEAKELRRALGARPAAATAERALRELLAVKGDVEYGTNLITGAKAEPLVRGADSLVELPTEIVRLGG